MPTTTYNASIADTMSECNNIMSDFVVDSKASFSHSVLIYLVIRCVISCKWKMKSTPPRPVLVGQRRLKMFRLVRDNLFVFSL